MLRKPYIAWRLIEKTLKLSDGKKLLQRVDYADRSPLYYAIQKNEVDIAEKLINELKDNPTCLNQEYPSEGITHLIYALSSSRPQISLFLVDALDYEAIKVPYGPFQRTPLMHSIYVGLEEVSLAIINKIHELSPPYEHPFAQGDLSDRTALHYAVQHNCKKVVDELVKRMDNLNIPDERYKTPLFYALTAKRDFPSLIGHESTDINHQDSEGHSPLITAVLSAYKKGFDILLARKADANLRSENGCTALYYAVENQNTQFLHNLIEYDADLNISDNGLKTPLMKAVGLNYEAGFRLLLAGGANANLRSKNGCTALYYAVANQNTQFLQELIKYEADLNISDNGRNTPLMKAVSLNYEAGVQHLIKGGAQLDIVNKENETALDIAKKNNFDKIRKILIQSRRSGPLRFRRPSEEKPTQATKRRKKEVR